MAKDYADDECRLCGEQIEDGEEWVGDLTAHADCASKQYGGGPTDQTWVL